MNVPLPPLTVFEGQRLHGSNAVESLKEERASLAFSQQNGACPLAIWGSIMMQPADNQAADREDDQRQQWAEEEHYRQEDEEG